MTQVSRYSPTAVAPLACAVINLVAIAALAFVLAPGTPVVADIAERERYLATHQLAWRAGWSVWVLAAASLLWFYAWWRRRIGGPHVALAIAALGIVCDWSAELALIVAGADGYRAVAEPAFVLTGTFANGLYTIAGIILTVATPLAAPARAYAAVMWSAGVALSLAALADIAPLVAVTTAWLFAMFIPWCVWIWRRLGA